MVEALAMSSAEAFETSQVLNRRSMRGDDPAFSSTRTATNLTTLSTQYLREIVTKSNRLHSPNYYKSRQSHC